MQTNKKYVNNLWLMDAFLISIKNLMNIRLEHYSRPLLAFYGARENVVYLAFYWGKISTACGRVTAVTSAG